MGEGEARGGGVSAREAHGEGLVGEGEGVCVVPAQPVVFQAGIREYKVHEFDFAGQKIFRELRGVDGRDFRVLTDDFVVFHGGHLFGPVLNQSSLRPRSLRP